jgi:hypothetical protein
MSRSAWRKPVRIADAIPGTFQRLGLESRFRQSEIWSVWPTVVGPQIARRAQPHAMWHGRLIVHVTDPVWLHHLSMMRHRVTAALNEKLQGSMVRELVLRIGEVTPPPTDPPGPLHRSQECSPNPSQLAWIEALLAPLADAPFLEALHRLLVRAYRPTGKESSR